VEINSSFYAIPSKKTIDSLCRRAPKGFLFTMKVYQEITHKGNTEPLPQMLDAVSTIPENGHGLMLLLQFPYSFHKTPENISYLQKVLEAIPFEKAVEMRHPAWFDEDLVRISQDFGFVPYR